MEVDTKRSIEEPGVELGKERRTQRDFYGVTYNQHEELKNNKGETFREELQEINIIETRIFPSYKHDEYLRTPRDTYLIKAIWSTEGEKAFEHVPTPSEDFPKSFEAANIDADFFKLNVSSKPLAYLLKSIAGGDYDVDFALYKLRNQVAPFRMLHRARTALRNQIRILTAEFGAKHDKDDSGTTPTAGSSSAHNQLGDRQDSVSTISSIEAHDSTSIKAKGKDENDNDLNDAQALGNEKEREKTREPHETEEALRHFCAINEFMDNYLPRATKKYNALRSGEQKTIEFSDLWMIFDTGDFIYAPSRRGIKIEIDLEEWGGSRVDIGQAFRVLSAQGAHLISSKKKISNSSGGLVEDMSRFNDDFEPTSIGNRKDRMHQLNHYTHMVIDCYRFDLDENKFGAVGDKFIIREYDGEIPISSLEVYPISPCMNTKFREKLLKRGSRFVDFSKITHKYYDAYTVGEIREKVR